MDEMTPSKQTLASSSIILVLWSQWNHHGETNTKLDIASYRMSVSSYDCWCPLGLCKNYETYHHCKTQTHSIPQPSRATKKYKTCHCANMLKANTAPWHFLGLNFHEFSELGMSVGFSHCHTIPIFKTGWVCESSKLDDTIAFEIIWACCFDSPT